MKRMWYYIDLAVCDLIRLWPGTQHHVVIVAGICLPILMLLGLKRGHVETLRKDLVTSPTGRQVTFWSAQRGELMSRSAIDRLATEIPRIDSIIPETQRVVRLRAGEGDASRTIDSATLYATRPGDPLLLQRNVDSPERGSLDLILSDQVAKGLGVTAGQEVTVVVSRGRGDLTESVEIRCPIKGIVPTDEHAAAVGYADLDLLDQFDAYIRGQRVAEFGWASARTPVADSYEGYVVFCERGRDLNDEDRDFYSDRGFRLTDRTDNPPAPLDRLLRAGFDDTLRVYLAETDQSAENRNYRLRIAPSELSEGTEADDVVLPWNRPRTSVIGDREYVLTGLSLPKRTWLREYLRFPQGPFDYEAEPWQANVVDDGHGSGHGSGDSSSTTFGETGNLTWALGSTQHVSLSVTRLEEVRGATDVPSEPMGLSAVGSENAPVASPTPPSGGADISRSSPDVPTPAILIVPANLLAWIAAHANGQAEYDPDVRLFVPTIQPAIYDRARLYAQTIDDVPTVVRELASKQFAVMSETGRIAEIQRQDHSLQLLVWVVGTGVFLFGVATVVSVLMDSTDRKRGVIGILRVMGMSRAGIFISILFRSIVIGGLAAALSVVCGLGIAVLLRSGLEGVPSLAWKPVVAIDLQLIDLAVVAAGAMICCGLGAIPPAWRASRLDPFDAIVEGRFR